MLMNKDGSSLSISMDNIQGLSNLEIETTNSSSQEVKEEVKRNWLELPADVMSLIFMKLDTIDILVNVQWVCSSWWKLSKQPHLFQSIDMDEALFFLGSSSFEHHSSLKYWREMTREAIDRSCGQLVEFSVRSSIATDEFLHYMSEKSSSLRRIRLSFCFEVSCDGWIKMAKKLPQLEELEIIDCSNFSKDVLETFGRFCPRLNSFRLNFMADFFNETELDGGLDLAIAENMPELRHLDLYEYMLTDDGLNAILDGCPHLELLDLRRCHGLKFEGDLIERCGNIKVFKA